MVEPVAFRADRYIFIDAAVVVNGDRFFRQPVACPLLLRHQCDSQLPVGKCNHTGILKIMWDWRTEHVSKNDEDGIVGSAFPGTAS